MKCSRCGTDIGNGAIDVCSVLSRLDQETGTVEILRFCLDRDDVTGCTTIILSGNIKE